MVFGDFHFWAVYVLVYALILKILLFYLILIP